MARRRRRRSSGEYHSHPTHPYSHPKATKHMKTGHYRRRSHKLPKRSALTGQIGRAHV